MHSFILRWPLILPLIWLLWSTYWTMQRLSYLCYAHIWELLIDRHLFLFVEYVDIIFLPLWSYYAIALDQKEEKRCLTCHVFSRTMFILLSVIWHLSDCLDCCSGVSSFNEFIHDLSIDSDDSSSLDYSSAEDDLNEDICHSPLSQGSRISQTSSFSRHRKHRTTWMALIISWILIPIKLLLALLSYLLFFPFSLKEGSPANSKAQKFPHVNSLKKMQTLRDRFIQQTMDRRRGVIEVLCDRYLRDLFT